MSNPHCLKIANVRKSVRWIRGGAEYSPPVGKPGFARSQRRDRSARLSNGINDGSFPGMNTTLTVDLDSGVLELAEQEARARHTRLPDVVARQLRVMAHNWQDRLAGRTPVTDSLRGAVKLPPDFDEGATLTQELQKKHGSRA